jgi:hypothetical protein
MGPGRRHLFFGIAVLGLGLLAALMLLRSRTREVARTEADNAAADAVDVERSEVTQRRAAGSLSGTVTASDGKALKNVRVCVGHVTSHLLGRVQTVCSITLSDGTYVIAGLQAGAYDVNALAAGYMPAAVDKIRDVVVLPGRETKAVDLVLMRGGAHLTGVVQDATGGPIEGASLTLWFGTSETHKATVESDEEGRFEAWVTPGTIGVTAHATGYTETLATHVAPSSDLLIRMAPGSTISGRVVRADRGAPVAGVEVRAVCDRCFDSAASPAAVSGADGRFQIHNLASASYSLPAEGERWLGGARDLVSIGIADTVSDVVVYVAPTLQVSGMVLHSNGEPCVRGTVHLGPGQPAGPIRPESSSEANAVPVLATGVTEAGDIHFRSVPAGSYAVSVQCDDHVVVDGPSTVEVTDKDTTGLVWHVQPGLQLTVEVVDGAGRPSPNTDFFFVTPAPVEGQPGTHFVFTTDDTGRRRLQRNLRPGRYEIQPYQADGATVAVELREGMAPAEATLRLDGVGSIEVTVRTSRGAPVNAVRVTTLEAAPPAALAAATPDASQLAAARRTNARDAKALGEGRFQFSSLRAGAYDIEIDDGLTAPITRTVQVGDQPVREQVVLDSDQSIVGRVIDGEGEPQRDAWVSASCATASAPEPDAQSGDLSVDILRETKRVVSDAQGRFTLTGISRAATACTVRAERPGSAVGEQRGVVPGRETTISLAALGALIGTARTAEGRAVTEFVINVITDDDERHSRSELITSDSGDWSLARVTPGKSTIAARTHTGETARLSIEVVPGQTVRGAALLFGADPAPTPLSAN